MINDSSKNTQLTAEQLLQIDTLQKRLTNLQNEITIHANKKDVLLSDNSRLENHIEYLKKTASEKEQEVGELEKRKITLKEEITTSESVLSKHTQEYKDMDSKLFDKNNELNDREKAVSEKEKENNQKDEILKQRETNLAQDKALADKKRQILSEVLTQL